MNQQASGVHYAPNCEHQHIKVKWRQETPGSAGTADAIWYIRDGVYYRGRAYCVDCQSVITDHDKQARKAFDIVLSSSAINKKVKD